MNLGHPTASNAPSNAPGILGRDPSNISTFYDDPTSPEAQRAAAPPALEPLKPPPGAT